MSIARTAVATSNAPAAIGPYSQAIRAGGLLFCSGQIAIDPQSGELVSGDIATETGQVLDNLAAVLEAGGSSLARVVKATIYLRDMGDFPVVNQVYGERMGDPPPARATVEVARLPKDVAVEIDAIALVD